MTRTAPLAIQAPASGTILVRWSPWLAVLILLAVLVAPSTAIAAVSASLDRDAVRLGESVRLVITFDDEAGPAAFDATPLEADFNVLGSSTSSQIRVTNNQRQVTTQLLVDLLPRREGRAVVPPLVFPGGVTESLALDVLPPGSGGAGGDVFLEVQAEPRSVYLQSPVYLSAKLFYRKSILEGNLSDPVLDNARVRRFGEDTQYRATRGGQVYRVIERRFVVIPQASGTLAVEPITFAGRVAEDDRGGGLFGGMFANGRHVSTQSQALDIEVRPPPASVTGPWFPARDVSLTESWPDDPPRFVVGEAVTRTLRVQADGVTGEQIPPIGVPTVDGIRHYPDKPVIDTAGGDRLRGTREQRVAMVPLRPGLFTLPAVEVGWWDTDADRARVARLPARQVRIEPATGVGQAAPPPASAGSGEVAGGDIDVQGSNDAPAGRATHDDVPEAWRWIALAVSVLWLLTLAAWWWERRHRQPAHSVPRDEPVAAPRVSLAKACRSGNPTAVRSALLDHARERWPDDPPPGLGVLAARLGDPALVAAFAQLDAACYAKGRRDFDGEAFYQRVASALKPAATRAVERRDVLPPLNPARRAGRREPVPPLHVERGGNNQKSRTR